MGVLGAKFLFKSKLPASQHKPRSALAQLFVSPWGWGRLRRFRSSDDGFAFCCAKIIFRNVELSFPEQVNDLELLRS